MDRPEWAASPDLATAVGRLAHRDRVNSGLASWTRTLGSSEVQDRCQSVGVPAGRVTNPFDQLEDPHLLDRGFLVQIDQTGLGPMVLEGTCIRGSGMPEPPCGPAPLIGEHSWSFCVQDLDMEPGEVNALLASGALEQATINGD
jgi:crotonobetainyl-CoA:carnitine CoA-transferase CaiB-like acyl-CoA transferase